MKLSRTVITVISFATILWRPAAAFPTPADLSTAKALYAAASYEEALDALSKIEGGDRGQIDQYQALCLLALGRAAEARQAFERLVTRQPRYTINDADFSPRVVTMFHEVRQQLLPGAAKDIYAKAKISVEKKQYTAASAQLKDMFAILEDADMPEDAMGLGNLKMLGEGFLALAEAQLAAARQAAANPQPATQLSTPVTGPAPAQEDAAIRNTLQAYAQAYSDRNATAVRNVFPSVDAARLQNSFNDLKSQQVVIAAEKITLNGATSASADTRVTTTARGSVGGTRTGTVTSLFSLEKSGSDWIIVGRR